MNAISATIRLLFAAAGFIACACLTQAQNSIPIVSMGAKWKYLDTGVDQGTAWIAPTFNDSGWASGPAQLGHGDGDEATVVGFGSDPNNKSITTYFRRSFVVNNPSAFTNVQMRILWNDGVVVYLNGMEVFRDYNMGTNAITFSTLALYPAEDYVFNPTVSPSLLVSGTNVLAVGVHLCATNSPDLSFDLGMAANVGIPVPGLPGGPFVERQVLGFNVRLVARPPAGVTNYLVREKPPFGQPGNISHGGSYDPATRTILFGPFADGQSRLLTYTDSPPLGSWGRFVFAGEAVANATSSAVVGDDYTEIPYFPSPPLEARLLLRWRPLSQQVALQRIGGGGAPWFVLASTNLQNWVYVGDLGNVFEGFELVDAGAPSHPWRFYRAQNIRPPSQR